MDTGGDNLIILLARAKKLTDQAWMAHSAGREFDYRRVESEFKSLLTDLRDSKVDAGGQVVSMDDFLKLVSGLAHANRIAARSGEQASFENIVKAFEPLANKGKVLDTG